MSNIPLFSGDISVFEDEDTGLRVECSEKYVSVLTADLAKAGFTYGPPIVAIPGTQKIHNFVEFPVSGGTFDKLSQTVTAHLHNAGVTVTPESFHSIGEKHDRFNLTNVSVFDK